MSLKVNKGAEVTECLKAGIVETKAIVEALAAKNIKVDPRYVRNIKSNYNAGLEKPTTPATAESPPPPLTEPEEPETPQEAETLEAVSPVFVPAGVNPEAIANNEAVKTALSKKDIAGIFKSINCLLPAKYRREAEQMDLLGGVWEAPLNRLMGKYVDQNSDLYVALVMTIIVFAPAGVAMMKDRNLPKESALK